MLEEKIINRIKKVKKDEDFFNTIIKGRGYYLTWKKIIDAMIFYRKEHPNKMFEKYNQKFKNLFPTSLTYPSVLQLNLENLGIDYNYKDLNGDNFIYYLVSSFVEKQYHTNEKKYFHYALSSVLEYIGNKTNELYGPDKNGKNLIFYLVESQKRPNANEDDFFYIIDKFPNFNLHQIDNGGKNLLFYCIEKNVYSIFEYLINKDVSCEIIDNYNNNLLHMIIDQDFSNEIASIADNLIEKIDIAANNKAKENFLNFCLKNTNSKNEKWSHYILDKIINKEFKCDLINIEEIKKILNDNSLYFHFSNDELKIKFKKAQMKLLDISIELNFGKAKHNSKNKI